VFKVSREMQVLPVHRELKASLDRLGLPVRKEFRVCKGLPVLLVGKGLKAPPVQLALPVCERQGLMMGILFQARLLQYVVLIETAFIRNFQSTFMAPSHCELEAEASTICDPECC
jgi:hypothetical protein